MTQPALIFDFGNVFAFFDYTRMGTTLGKSLGLSGEQFLDRIRQAGFTPLLQAYESGKMPAEEFGQAVCALVGLELSHDEFASAWRDIFWLNEPVVKLIADLRASGYTLVLGSNTNELHATHFLQQFAEALAPFHHLVLSYKVGQIKPATSFYLACAKAAGEAPEACIFIDDLPENVAGANAAGLRGVLFQDVPTLKDDLRQLGVDLTGIAR
ncbi:MAG: haloacid dehalogenase superfamily protein subfamily variant 3 with third motif having or [Planctomycetota bacterium]|nr:haloacid dehalogenase superfamily protein subfamily variant 3 with third motif having or [Planctomycetota bacterium]